MNQLTREKSVVIVTLADENKLSIKIKIETLGPMIELIKDDNIANIFLQKRINENGIWTGTIIQTIVYNNDMIEYNFYDKDS